MARMSNRRRREDLTPNVCHCAYNPSSGGDLTVCVGCHGFGTNGDPCSHDGQCLNIPPGPGGPGPGGGGAKMPRSAPNPVAPNPGDDEVNYELGAGGRIGQQRSSLRHKSRPNTGSRDYNPPCCDPGQCGEYKCSMGGQVQTNYCTSGCDVPIYHQNGQCNDYGWHYCVKTSECVCCECGDGVWDTNNFGCGDNAWCDGCMCHMDMEPGEVAPEPRDFDDPGLEETQYGQRGGRVRRKYRQGGLYEKRKFTGRSNQLNARKIQKNGSRPQTMSAGCPPCCDQHPGTYTCGYPDWDSPFIASQNCCWTYGAAYYGCTGNNDDNDGTFSTHTCATDPNLDCSGCPGGGGGGTNWGIYANCCEAPSSTAYCHDMFASFSYCNPSTCECKTSGGGSGRYTEDPAPQGDSAAYRQGGRIGRKYRAGGSSLTKGKNRRHR